MTKTNKMRLIAGVSLASLLNFVAAAAQAADADASNAVVEEVIVTGTRQTGLKVIDSPAPVQVVDTAALTRSGQTDLRIGLANMVPSFNAQAFGGDTANLTLSARLRGLSPNQALVLVNGKRRHTTANLAVLSGAYQGAAATDLNFIPMASIGRIEVLTDGAAAQYGTDAIAGVINVILKKNDAGGQISATGGEYMDEGGKTAAISANVGFAPIENSYVNLTAETKFHGFSNRGLPDQRVFNPLSPSYSAANNAVEKTDPRLSQPEPDLRRCGIPAEQPGLQRRRHPARRGRALFVRQLRPQGCLGLRELSPLQPYPGQARRRRPAVPAGLQPA